MTTHDTVPFVIRGKNYIAKNTIKESQVRNANIDGQIKIIKLDADTENLKPKSISVDNVKMITEGRAKLKLKRSELAAKMNMKESILANYETVGFSNIKMNEINAINRVLGIKLYI
jgi:ribosome-binding protein aMBF1 (putative translation factor)